MKLIVEPTGCLGLAAARAMKDRLKGRRIGIILSGGNVDIQGFCALLTALILLPLILIDSRW